MKCETQVIIEITPITSHVPGEQLIRLNAATGHSFDGTSRRYHITERKQHPWL